MRKALVFGSGGQLGTELLRRTWPADFEPVVAPLESFDFAHPETLETKIAALAPHALVNAAAYTAVDKAESERDLADRVNAQAPEALARAAAKLSIPLLHVSTDYVFDGELVGREYTEEDRVCPISVYGETKERGESLIRGTHDAHVIVRTSWVYSAFSANFVKTMLRLGQERPELLVVDDQVGRPTHAGELAGTLLEILSSIADGSRSYGTYNFAGGAAMSWREFAEAIFTRATKHGLKTPKVTPIATTEYPTPARRPKNSRLDGTKLAKTFGVHQPDFDAALDQCVAELCGVQQ